ncbi:HAMP domain-containing histidine kinase, partial [Candidatus Bipolaricaulota bacterium]|nr:HAMP domain-containing histidine kinase [Candidatus Bipolaricaulota bacterium]
MRDQVSGVLDPSAQAKATKAMLRSTETMVQMSKTYLSLSRVENGELRLQLFPCRLYEDIIRPAAEMMEQRLQERKIRLRLDDEASLKDATLDLDVALMRVVYMNLLDNAIKYGRIGGEIVCGHSENDQSHRLSVWNDGDGIPADKLDLVFEKFVRIGIAEGGSGLGLFNTKTIVERHGGTIRAESEEGERVNFVILFPRKMAPGDESGEASPGNAEGRAPSEQA